MCIRARIAICLLLCPLFASGDGLASTLDLSSPDLLVGAELHGMGGAGLAFANGASGLCMQPAAPAHRRAEQDKRTQLGLSGVLTEVQRDGSPDLGPGVATGWRSAGTSGGLSLLSGNLGVGAGLDLHIAGPADTDKVLPHWEHATALLETRLGIGIASPDGRAVIAAGPHLLSARIAMPDSIDADAIGLDVGAILHLGSGLAVAVVGRSPLIDQHPGGVLPAGVTAVEKPAELHAGLGWSSLAASSTLPPLRLAADVLIVGEVADGVSPDPLLFVEDRLDSSLDPELPEKGRAVTASPRAGAEVGLLRERLRLRAGTWWEPPRTALTEGRLHGTAGVEVKLFPLKLLHGRIDTHLVWRMAVDVARDGRQVRLLSLGASSSGVVGGEGWPRLAPDSGVGP